MLSFLLCSIIFFSFLNLSFISLLLWPYFNTTDDSVFFFFCLLTVLLIVLDVRAGNFYFIFLLIVRAGNF